MAVGAIENATIARVQDYSAIKQNEDNKGLVHQMNIGQDREQDDRQKAHQVRQGDETLWQNKRPDAREKGSNEYHGNGGRDRKGKKQEADQMVIKNRPRQGFDVKI
ncbi:MAG: hypothetical protein J6B43_12845 [Lachnospiraceae bacterium]|nr:hypothetical protein [Lachnospiraceae bacterium]